MGDSLGGSLGKGNWADPTGLVQKSGMSKVLDPLGFTKTSNKESAADRAQRLEEERQARIADTQAKINEIFSAPGREGEIADAIAAIREERTGDLNRQKADADRSLTFALARNGLIGGSTQRDQQQRMAEDYSRNLLNVERQSQGFGANLRAADQDARARLITLATQGLDATTAAQQASAALGSNLESSRAEAQGQQLGDLFAGQNKLVTNLNDAAAIRRANRDAGQQLYQPSAATSFYYGGRA